MIKLSSKFGLISGRRAIGRVVDIMTNSNHTSNAWIKCTAHVPSILNAKLWAFPFHSSFLSGFLWTRRQPYNYPSWTLVSPTTFWTDISLALAPTLPCLEPMLHAQEKTRATAEHPLTYAPSSPSFFKLPSHGPSYPWQTPTVVYMLKNSFHITCCNLRHLQFELSHLPKEECIVPGVSEKNESCLTCICNSMFPSKPPLLGSSTLIPHSWNIQSWWNS